MDSSDGRRRDDAELWRLYDGASRAARRRTTSPRTDPPGAYGLRAVYDAGRRDQRAAIQADAADIDAADIWDEGFTALADEDQRQRADPTYPIHRINPYRRESDTPRKR